VLFRVKRKGIDVDTSGRDVGVVLVRLDLVEVAALTLLETIVTVELDLGNDGRVLAGHTLNAGNGVTRLKDRAIPPVRVVEGLLALPGVDDGVITRDEGITLDNPDELLDGVVVVELELVTGRGDRLATGELEDLNEVLVRDLGELTTLISIKVDVVNEEGGSNETSGIDTIADLVVVGGDLGGIVPAEIAEIVELKIDTDLVVLEGDEGESKTRVAAEPELERDVESVLGSTVGHLLRSVGLTSTAVAIAADTTLLDDVGELGNIANHLGVTGLLTGLLGELIPDVEPVTIVLVNALTTDLKLNGLDEEVTNPVEPTELSTRTILGEEGDLGESGLEIHTVD
jgi:hypothetical protein